MKNILGQTFSILALAIGVTHQAGAQPAAFTYQGKLTDDCCPATGLYDLTFKVFDAATAGTQLPTPTPMTVTKTAVPVTNGLFTVSLDFTSAPFTGARRWLQIDARTNNAALPYATLAPRTELTPTPYALFANTVGSVSPTALAALPGNGQFLRYSGGSLQWANAPEVGGLWQPNGTSAYYDNGNVGIGSSSPQAPLHISANSETIQFRLQRTGTAAGFADIGADDRGLHFWPGGYNFSAGKMLITPGGVQLVGANSFLEFFNPGQSAFRWLSEGDFFSRKLSLIDTTSGNPQFYRLTIDGGGNVGIGTTTPLARLHVAGGSAVFDNPGGAIRVTKLTGQLSSDDLGIWNRGLSGSQPFAIADWDTGTKGLFINTSSGNVGVGTAEPKGALHVANGGLAVTGRSSPYFGAGPGMFMESDGTKAFLFAYNYNSFTPQPLLLNSPGGNVGIGTDNPQAKLDVAGETRTCVLTITGGCDLAEPFDVSEKDIPKGAVVVIDEENPGHLKMSDRPYDNRVAGIISGANGINTGIMLKQEGALEGTQNVALTGRVYALADAAESPIKPGDLLTTSATPGHAMKAADRELRGGAILGKAMTGLKEGKGHVLVLVNLQ